MNRSEMINAAAKLVIEKCSHSFDKSGIVDYLHPMGVFGLLAGQPVEVRVVGLLHDIVEDTDVTLKQLSDMGFPDEVVDAVDHLTRRDGEPYDDYIRRLCLNLVAIAVKTADIQYNNCRIDDGIQEADAARMRAKWKKAIDIMTGDSP